MSYQVHTRNPAIAEFTSTLEPDQREAFQSIVAGINRGVPLDSIFADLASTPNSVKPPDLEEEASRSLVLTVAHHHLGSGKTLSEVLEVVEVLKSTQ